MSLPICPKCKANLNIFDDFGAEYAYCPECNDIAYDVDTFEPIGKIPDEPDEEVIQNEI